MTRAINKKCVVCNKDVFAEFSYYCWDHSKSPGNRVSGGMQIILNNTKHSFFPDDFKNSLDDRQKIILKDRFENNISLRKIGNQLGISGEFVRVLEYKIAKKYVTYRKITDSIFSDQEIS